MRRILLSLSLFLLISISSEAQIYINGKGSYRPYSSGGTTALSISYGTLFWNDSQQKELTGYSEGLNAFNGFSIVGFQKFNYNLSLRLGLEKGLSDKLSLKSYLIIGKLYTGVLIRPDLEATDKSKIFQLSTYGNYTLSDPAKKFKVHLIFGPEFMFVKKDVFIANYVEVAGNTPDNYFLRESIFEVGVSAGFGLSFDISKKIVLFSDGLLGISLPGSGLKITNSGFGLKYVF